MCRATRVARHVPQSCNYVTATTRPTLAQTCLISMRHRSALNHILQFRVVVVVALPASQTSNQEPQAKAAILLLRAVQALSMRTVLNYAQNKGKFARACANKHTCTVVVLVALIVVVVAESQTPCA